MKIEKEIDQSKRANRVITWRDKVERENRVVNGTANRNRENVKNDVERVERET